MGEAAGSGKEWFLKVVTDAGKRYSLEVKGDIATLSAEVVKPKLAEKTGVPARKQVLPSTNYLSPTNIFFLHVPASVDER